jgi:hypothetical protein
VCKVTNASEGVYCEVHLFDLIVLQEQVKGEGSGHRQRGGASGIMQ